MESSPPLGRPHPLDVTDAPDDVTPQRHCAGGCPRSGLAPRDVSRGVVDSVQVTSLSRRSPLPHSSVPPTSPLLGDRRGISHGQLITEAVVRRRGGGGLVNYSRGTRECSNINECTCYGVSSD